MMRSMFSGVSGLKTHQTKMDVIGNNIANVNTTSFKADSINFSELLYQSKGYASAANVNTGRAGINPKQIGLGVQTAAINKTITSGGAAMSTGIGTDVKINGDAFFIVSPDGTTNYFTRDGSFYIDGAGNLATTQGGLNVMGWQVDETTGEIVKDTVSALRVMSAANLQYPPEATTEGYISGILDRNEPDAASDAGKMMNFAFYDQLGYSYTARFAIKNTEAKGEYSVELKDILDSNGVSLKQVYNVASIEDIVTFGSTGSDSGQKLTQLLDGVSYTTVPGAMGTNADPYKVFSMEGTTSQDTGKIYFKSKPVYELLGNYAETRVPGLTYTVDDKVFAGKYIDPATGTITMTGTGILTKQNLIDKGIVQSEDDPNVFFQAELKDGKYEYIKGSETLYTGKGGTTINMEHWAKALGVDKDTLKLDFDTAGNSVSVKMEIQQSFTADPTGSGFIYQEGQMAGTAITYQEALGLDPDKEYSLNVLPDGQAYVTGNRLFGGYTLKYDVDTGLFKTIGPGSDAGGDTTLMDFKESAITNNGVTVDLQAFKDITIDWSKTVWYNNGGASTLTANAGLEGSGIGAGRRVGNMSGIAISSDGTIYATYDNGMNRLVGQIAVARFANASGLEKAGDNLYTQTSNSGAFNGIGEDITQNGTDSMTTGVLEMSNVDLSNEFTHMITTQRGFQANSRVITVSDTLLEELINLKR